MSAIHGSTKLFGADGNLVEVYALEKNKSDLILTTEGFRPFEVVRMDTDMPATVLKLTASPTPLIVGEDQKLQHENAFQLKLYPTPIEISRFPGLVALYYCGEGSDIFNLVQNGPLPETFDPEFTIRILQTFFARVNCIAGDELRGFSWSFEFLQTLERSLARMGCMCYITGDDEETENMIEIGGADKHRLAALGLDLQKLSMPRVIEEGVQFSSSFCAIDEVTPCLEAVRLFKIETRAKGVITERGVCLLVNGENGDKKILPAEGEAARSE
jgi:hypothetical protein